MQKKIRYAVVGLGYIAQIAVLPAFKHAKNSELVALVSGDAEKLKKLGKKYGAKWLYSYNDVEECFSSGLIDAVYIALPNNMHLPFTELACRYGIHVLCEKPMAVTEDECYSMIQSARETSVKLMIAYRLHFERSNMEAVKIAQSGKLGDVRIFTSTFTEPVTDRNNIRLKRELGGGTLFDIGIYCINAARYIFKDEPIEVTAFCANGGQDQFDSVEEMISVIMRFPQERLASFTVSFAAAKVNRYEIIGTKGVLRAEETYDYAGAISHSLTIDGKTKTKRFSPGDQFAPELVYFSNCIVNNLSPEPSGIEGLADVRIINALYESARSGVSIHLDPIIRHQRPDLSQAIKKPVVEKPKLIHAHSPSGK